MKKMIALVLVVSMLFGVAAAMAEADENMQKWNEETQYILDTFPAYYQAQGEGFMVAPFDEPITITIAKDYRTEDETRMAAFSERYGESFEENRWTYIYSKGLNLNFDFTWWALRGDDYNQKLRLEMAANKLPDVFLVYQQSDVLQLAEAGVIQEVRGLIDEYATKRLKDILESDGGMGYDMVTYEDGVYGVPKRASDTDAFSYLWVRKDWMKKLNLEWPQTIEELEAIMKAFTAADFDGNGQADTLGMVVDKDIWYTTRGLFGAYNAYPEYWVETEAGELAYGATQPQVKQALTTLQHFYREGYIDREFATKSNGVAIEAVLNGKCGVVYGGHWLGHTFGDLHELDPESDWECLALPSATGEPVRAALAPNVSAWYCISKSCENPEAVLKALNLWDYAFFNAKDAAWFNYDENDSRNIAPIAGSVAATDNIDTYNLLQEMLKTGDQSILTGKAIAYWGNFETPGLVWEWKLMFGQGNTPLKVLKDAYENGYTFYNAFVGPQNEMMQQRWSTIRDEFDVVVTKIILDEVSVEEGFDQWLKTFDALGGTEITAYVNQWKDALEK